MTVCWGILCDCLDDTAGNWCCRASVVCWSVLERVASAAMQVLCVGVYWSVLECVGSVFECLFECVEVCCTYTHTRG